MYIYKHTQTHTQTSSHTHTHKSSRTHSHTHTHSHTLLWQQPALAPHTVPQHSETPPLPKQQTEVQIRKWACARAPFTHF